MKAWKMKAWNSELVCWGETPEEAWAEHCRLFPEMPPLTRAPELDYEYVRAPCRYCGAESLYSCSENIHFCCEACFQRHPEYQPCDCPSYDPNSDEPHWGDEDHYDPCTGEWVEE